MRVAIVWRGDESARQVGLASNERLRPVADALAQAGFEPVPVVYRDAVADEVRSQLSAVSAALVWVDPLGLGEARGRLDTLLRDVASQGVWVSAHPDTIAALGTKEVLYATRELAFGSDVAIYRTAHELQAGLRDRLAWGARVLKPRYGNGGIGVWKVERVDNETVRVHGAEVRDLADETCAFDAFVDRCADALAAGCVVDQPFQARVAEGLIRCYLVGDQVVGFAHQGAESLVSDSGDAHKVMGLPSPKTMFPANHPEFARLHALMTDELPRLLGCVGLTAEQLPVLWDADFLRSDDGYVLCEINCSCVTPFPPEAPAAIAEALLLRLS